MVSAVELPLVGGGGCEFFFFFKQKTAYEIKECDWSSDVCSSDLKKVKPSKIFMIIAVVTSIGTPTHCFCWDVGTVIFHGFIINSFF